MRRPGRGELNRLDGVAATVNLPLESAHVVLSTAVTDQDLVGAVESAGYEARVTRRRTASGTVDPSDEVPGASAGPGDEYRGDDLLRRLRVSAVLTVPVLLLSMVPALAFPGSEWVVAALALPVVAWGAWPFHTAAVRAARHALPRWTRSCRSACWRRPCGRCGCWSPTRSGPRRTAADPGLYFEVGAVVTTFLLAGRYAEHRSRRRAGDALRALLNLGAKDAERIMLGPDATPLRRADGGWRTTAVPVAALQVGDVFAGTARRDGGHGRDGGGGHLGPRHLPGHGRTGARRRGARRRRRRGRR